MTAREDRSFAAVHEKHRPEILRFLSRLAGEHEAEDLAQEVFLKVERGLGGFRGDSGIRSWIFQVARNTAIDRLRSRAAEEKSLGVLQTPGAPGDGGDVFDVLESGHPSPERILARKETNACVRAHVDRLPEPYREAMALSEWGEMTDAEIAGRLGVTLGTVKIRLHRARARLKKECGARCTVYRDERSEPACVPKPACLDPGRLPQASRDTIGG
jgi:RNA polymerase sigma-70 factor (ECF subfamily)